MHTRANTSPFPVKKRLFLNAVCYIDSYTAGYFWSYETKNWSFKSNLILIQKCHKLTRISFIKIDMKHDPEWIPD